MVQNRSGMVPDTSGTLLGHFRGNIFSKKTSTNHETSTCPKTDVRQFLAKLMTKKDLTRSAQKCLGPLWDHPRPIRDHSGPILDTNRLTNYIMEIPITNCIQNLLLALEGGCFSGLLRICCLATQCFSAKLRCENRVSTPKCCATPRSYKDQSN